MQRVNLRRNILYSKKVPISESALLVIDAQDSFKVGPRWERRRRFATIATVDNIAKELAEAKRQKASG